MGEKVFASFSEFYADVRGHFSACADEYDAFKANPGTREKIEHLMGHEYIRKSLARLPQIKRTKVDRPEDGGKEEDGKWVNSKSSKFPQLTSKAKLSWSKKCGRMIVAAEKIMPGKEMML